MGPVRDATEPKSDYRFRYARYCLGWLVGLGLPLLLLMLWAPSVRTSPAPLVTMFLYVGLPIGVGSALLALLGFMVGGFWSRATESSPHSARRLERVKFTLITVLLLPVFGLAIYLSLSGLLSHEVHAFSKNPKHIVAWSSQPGWYVVNVLLWGALGFGGLAHVIRKLRSVYVA